MIRGLLLASASTLFWFVPLGCQVERQSVTPDAPPPPLTRIGIADTSYHGVTVSDPYRWLEDDASPEVQRWIAAQNAYSDTVLSSFAGARALTERLEALERAPAGRSSPVIAGRMLYFLRETPPRPHPVLVAAPWPTGRERVLVDANAAGGGTRITGYWPSPSGRFVAYGLAAAGNEVTTVHFLDLTTGAGLPDTLPYAGGGASPPALAWDADETGVVYARYPLPADSASPPRPFDVALYRHAFGVPNDSLVFGELYSRIARYRLLASGDGAGAALLAYQGAGGSADVFLRQPSGWQRVFDTSAGIVAAAYAGPRLLVVATRGAPRGRVMAVAPDGSTSNMLDEGDGAVQSIAPVAGGVLVVRVSGARWRLDHYANSGALVRTVALPVEGISIGDIASSAASHEALISWTGWTAPPRWQRYNARTGGLRTVFEVQPAADYSLVKARVIEAASNDGTRVPVTVLARDGTPQDGTAPAILHGDGGFRSALRPTFIGSQLAWLERGGVLAYANIRGGGEFGEAWHEGAMKARKQNAFDDFHAAARALVREKWTSIDRLGIRGTGNGGLLVGAMVTRYPESFRAGVGVDGMYDMLRHETLPGGAYQATEYGSTADAGEFAALFAYSPLHRVKRGTAYPALLLQVGAHEGGGAPWESRKFTATLQAATTSGRPVLYLQRPDTGRGGLLQRRLADAVPALVFFAQQLRLRVDATAAAVAR